MVTKRQAKQISVDNVFSALNARQDDPLWFGKLENGFTVTFFVCLLTGNDICLFMWRWCSERVDLRQRLCLLCVCVLAIGLLERHNLWSEKIQSPPDRDHVCSCLIFKTYAKKLLLLSITSGRTLCFFQFFLFVAVFWFQRLIPN